MTIPKLCPGPAKSDMFPIPSAIDVRSSHTVRSTEPETSSLKECSNRVPYPKPLNHRLQLSPNRHQATHNPNPAKINVEGSEADFGIGQKAYLAHLRNSGVAFRARPLHSSVASWQPYSNVLHLFLP